MVIYHMGDYRLRKRWIIRVNAHMKSALEGIPANFMRMELQRAIIKWYRLKEKRDRDKQNQRSQKEEDLK